ncbi:MAG: glycosyltransferase [Chloroflexota bacterium]
MKTLTHGTSCSAPVHLLYLITDLGLGGAQTLLLNVLERLDRQRFSPSVACLFGGQTPIAAAIRQSGVTVFDLGMTGAWRLDALWRLYRLLRSQQPAILHASLFHANLAGRLVGRLAGTPVIVTWRHNINIGGKQRELAKRLTRGLDDHVVAVSELVRRAEMQAAGGGAGKVSVIHNGIDAQKYAPSDTARRAQVRQALELPADSFPLGYVGRLHPQKGLDVLLKAFSQARAQAPDMHLLLAGDGELRTALQAQAQSLGIDAATHFLGPRSDIPEILAGLDLFVLASLWEGLPMGLLEAMAAGLPVVATQVGGTPEAVRHNETGLLVPPNDRAALAQAILQMHGQPDLRRRLGQAARQRAQEVFSIEQTVKKLEALYLRLLRKKGLNGGTGSSA